MYKSLFTEMPNTPGYIVAVKTLHSDFHDDREALMKEAAIMAQFQHDRVVRLVGTLTF